MMKYIGLFLLIFVGFGVVFQLIMMIISLSLTLSQKDYTFEDVLEKLGFSLIFFLPLLFFYWIGINLYKEKWKV
jgi:apolipoprotein N-acyltransferase